MAIDVSDDTAISTLDAFIEKSGIDRDDMGWRTRLPKPPKATFDKGRTYSVQVETNKGPMKIRLMPDVAPMHVSSFLYLTRLGFFDGLSFHRVIKQFMAQGGCPQGDGRGGPGYRFDGEFDRTVRHDRPYLLSMANAGPGTDGSQFFITFVPTPHLDDAHSIFGEVVEGQATVQALEASGSRSGATSEPLQMKKVTVVIEEA